MKIISFINYKGGVGKTTLASNIAADLAKRGKRVLGIDLDPQTNFTFSFFKVDEWKNNFQNMTIKNWYDDFINNRVVNDITKIIVRPQKIKELTNNNLDIICSHLGLINVELDLALMLGAMMPSQQRKNYHKVHSHLADGLKTLKGKYDVIIIDCPPNFNIVTKNALIASDYYVFPAKPDYLSTLGIEELKRHINDLIKEYNNNIELLNDRQAKKISPKPLGMIANMIGVTDGQPISKHKFYITEVQNRGVQVFNTMLRDSKSIYADAPEDCMPVVLSKTTDDTSRKVKSELERLTSEFIQRAGL